MKRQTIIEKIIETPCYKCSCTGKVDNIECDVCGGTGFYKETFYYMIDEKNKICFSGDSLK